MTDAEERLQEVTVSPEEIERLLKKMRAERGGKVDVNSGPSAIPNVILANFVIAIPASLKIARDKIEMLLEELALLVPSRFFIVSLSQADSPQLATAVRVAEIKSSSGQDFFSEEIFVETSKSSVAFVPSLLRSLCKSDVPIICYVLGEPVGEVDSDVDRLLNYLREMCDLILYDSLEFKNYTSSVASLFSLRRIVRPHNEEESRKLAPSSVRLRDLNWYRLEKLRALLANIYDAGAFSRSAIKSVEVVIGQASPTPTSLILLGWLNEILAEDGLVKIVSAKAGASSIKILIKGDGFELSVSQEGDHFEVANGGSVRKLNAKPLTTAELISLPVQSSGLDDYFTKSLERSLEVN